MIKKLFLFSFLVFSFSFVKAQHYFNISLLGGIPQASFAENTDDFHLGLGLDLMFKVNPDFPLYLGIGYNYNAMGSKSQTIQNDLQVMAGTTVISTIPVKLGVQTNNNLSNWIFKTRFVFPTDYVHPYAQLSGGLNYLSTNTTVTDETEKHFFTSDHPDDNTITSKKAISDLTYAYGGGAGLLIDAGSGCIELGVDYMWGGNATYFNKDQIKDWTVTFSGTSGSFDPNDPKDVDLSNTAAIPYQSYTDIIYVHIGYTFKFGQQPKKKSPVHHTTTPQHHNPPPKKKH